MFPQVAGPSLSTAGAGHSFLPGAREHSSHRLPFRTNRLTIHHETGTTAPRREISPTVGQALDVPLTGARRGRVGLLLASAGREPKRTVRAEPAEGIRGPRDGSATAVGSGLTRFLFPTGATGIRRKAPWDGTVSQNARAAWGGGRSDRTGRASQPRRGSGSRRRNQIPGAPGIPNQLGGTERYSCTCSARREPDKSHTTVPHCDVCYRSGKEARPTAPNRLVTRCEPLPPDPTA